MTTNEKIAQLEKRGKAFTDFLDECGLRYRIVIVSKDGNNTFELNTLTNVEKVTDLVCTFAEILQKSGTTREVLFTHVNNALNLIEEDEGNTK